jgi:hypothetical protein
MSSMSSMSSSMSSMMMMTVHTMSLYMSTVCQCMSWMSSYRGGVQGGCTGGVWRRSGHKVQEK